MAIYSERNLYPGVNAHLNSFLQQSGGGWESFHTRQINDFQSLLDEVLPPNYYAISEKSLQVTQMYIEEDKIFRVRPDVSIYRTDPSSGSNSTQQAALPSAVLPIIDLDEDSPNAVGIYRIDSGQLPGVLVTRIEILSPANKHPHPYHQLYLGRRIEVLRGGVALVEIDYLHESHAVLPLLPSYPIGDAEPYYVLVSKPVPSLEDGVMEYYSVGVVDPLPKIEIPLSGNDAVTVDFGALYNRSITQSRIFRIVVDYAQDPVNFDRYTPADQAKIHALLDEIRHTNPKTSE